MPPAPTTQAAKRERLYAGYVLGVLMLVSVFNYIDRQSLAILQIPIKLELGLSDTQLGSLTGLSFAVLYSSLAVPIARLADRYNRVWLVSIALAIWSVMTAASGLAVGMVTLTLCRMGVAFGEAGCVPASHSILADYFARRQRATAIATWALSFPLGTMLGFMSGGWLSSAFGWRHAFMILGIAGICLIPLMLTLREPLRGAKDETVVAAPNQPVPLMQAIRTLCSLRTLVHATFAGALVDFTLYATLNWNAPFYNRTFGLAGKDLAVHMALLSGVGSGLGVYFAGRIADRMGRRDMRWYLWTPALAAIIAVPSMCVQYFVPQSTVSLLAGYLPAALLSCFLAPLVASAQLLVPANLRAFTSAILALVVNIVGLGLGPLVTGMLSDLFASRYGVGQNSLRYAIALSAIPALWAALHFFRAAHYFRAELSSGSTLPATQASVLRSAPNHTS